jgi:hypothetical protein
MNFDLKKNYFIVVIIAIHLVWFLAGMQWSNFYNGDSYEYIYLAESISKGHYYGANPVMPVIDYRMSSRTPTYPLFLLTFYTLFGKSNILILLFQNILSVASCCIMLNTFRRIDSFKKYTWIYLLFIVFYPAQMVFATVLAPDTLLQFFLVLYFWQLFLSIYEPKASRIGYMSLWLVLAVMTKPIMYPFLFLHFGFALWYAFRSKSKMIVFTGAIPLLVIMSYGLWNKQRTGLFHISSVESNNLLYFNTRFFLVSKYGEPYADSVIRGVKKRVESMDGLKQKYKSASREATAIIKNDLFSYGRFHLKESIRFFVEPGKSELDLYTGYLSSNFDPKALTFYRSYNERGIAGAWDYLKSYPWLPLVLLVFLFNLVRIVGVFLFIFNKRLPLSLRILSTVYLLYFGAITGPVSNTRYFLPVLLVMSCMATVGYAGWIEKIKNKKRQLSI